MACGGVVGTAYLGWRAGHQVANTCILYPEETSRRDRIVSDVKHHWKQHIPVVVTSVVTIGCIIMGTRVGVRRTAAMAAAYSVSERAFTEYREKVEEKFGKNKEQAVRDEVAQDNVTKTAPGPSIVLLGGGTTIFYEYFTGRYFLSDMETLRRAENEINARVLRCEYATLAEFHTLIGQPPTQGAMDMGWDKEGGLLDLETTPCFTNDASKAAIEFRYSYLKAL